MTAVEGMDSVRIPPSDRSPKKIRLHSGEDVPMVPRVVFSNDWDKHQRREYVR